MNENTFDQNLLRTLAAQTWTMLLMQASQEVLGKSYLTATPVERGIVEKLMFDHIGGNYALLTPAFLAGEQKNEGFGFQGQPGQK